MSNKTIFTILLGLKLAVFSLQAQEHKELLHQLTKQGEGKERVNTLLRLSDYYIYRTGNRKTDLDSAFTFTKQADLESIKIKYAYGNCRSLSLYARIYGERQDKKQCIAYANKALKAATAANFQDVCGEAYKELYAQCNYYEEIDKKIAYLDKSVQAFRTKGSKLQLADIVTIAAEDYNYLGESEKSMAFLQEALLLYKAIGHKDMLNAYRVAGSLYAARGDYRKSIDYLLKAAAAGEGVKYADEMLGYIYNQLSANYYHLHDKKLSDFYLQKSLEYALKTGNKEAIYTATNNIVFNLISYGKYNEAEKFLKNIYRQHKPVSIADIFTVNDCFISIYTRLKQYDRAQAYCNKIIALINSGRKDIPQQILFNANTSLSRFYLAKGDYPSAKKYLEANLTGIEERSYTAKKRMYTIAYQLDSATGNLPRAIEYLKKIKTVDDSVFNIEKNKEISQLQISYDSEKKDKDILLKAKSISLLNKEKELQKHRIEQTGIQKNIAFAGVIIALIAAFAIFMAYRNKSRLMNLLQKQKEEITDKNGILNKLVGEKEWLLKEVHHRVKNNLQIVMSLLNTQSAYLTDEAAKSAIGDSQRRMHSIALIHQQLYKSDNVSAIKMYRYISELVSYLQDSYDSTLVKFEIEVDDIELDVAQTIPIGLILNEAITNAFKYAFNPAEKGLIKISLCQAGKDVYELRISDNGKGLPDGFDPDNCNSLGMQLLSGLSGDLNGTFKIYNDGGTVIKIVFTNIFPLQGT
jgi:two-component sensor histidine kinase